MKRYIPGSDSVHPSKESLVGQGLWLALHFPLLGLEVHYLGDEPAVLLSGQARVLLANDAAVAAGISENMALATASSLCPSLRCYSSLSTAENVDALHTLAIWSGQFSAQISLYPPDTLILEIASMCRYFGGPALLWQKVEDALTLQAFSCYKATGHTPLAAFCLAKAKRNTCAFDDKGHEQILYAMPIQQLGLTNKQHTLLKGMGIASLAHLETLARADLSQRFGPELLNYLDRLLGRLSDPQTPFTPPLTFHLYRELHAEAEYTTGLLFPLKPMLATLAGYLRLVDRYAVRLDLTLHYRDQSSALLAVVHHQGSADPKVWLEFWRLKFEQYRLAQPVVALTLIVTDFTAGRRMAADLFEVLPNEDVSTLLDRLSNRLGECAVSYVGNGLDPRPEKSAALTCIKNTQNASKRQLSSKAINALSYLRPLWLLTKPEPLDSQYVTHCIVLENGPERISSGWWDQQPIRRDYYCGRWPDGRLGWLYFDDKKSWYLHGWFG